ncbi:hypothetical protein ABFX02_04G061300 [Erythranthe guttata]
MGSPFSSHKFAGGGKLLLILGFISYLTFFTLQNHYPPSDFISYLKKTSSSLISPPPAVNNDNSRTNLSHLVFGLLGSEKAWHNRKSYIESWWRPNTTKGFLYLDKPPTGDLLPWPETSPPYRISDDLTEFLKQNKPKAPIMIRMVHAIMEIFKEINEKNNNLDIRWFVMGDDDSVFFVDNIVDVLAEYDHTKYYYIGGQSEFVLSNYWFSFQQGFGGAGFMLSYRLAKALAMGMENCLRRYAYLRSADYITMVCISDIGVNLSPHKGIHQIDLHGDISGLLSSHPKSPLISLHHLDKMKPIFPNMDSFESTRHLMKAAAADQTRMLQQTICHHRRSNWTFSVSWGYSANIYERVMPRSYLQKPIETFKPWVGTPETHRPFYMFNTRLPSDDPCEKPHVFFFKGVEKASSSSEILTTYSRAAPRGLGPCSDSPNAEFVSEIRVFSPATKREEMDRCECCDIVGVDGGKAELRFRECLDDEIIA